MAERRLLSKNVIYQDQLADLEAQLSYKEERWMYLTELKEKTFFVNGVFERYVFLRSIDKPGQIDAIFDGEFNKVL